MSTAREMPPAAGDPGPPRPHRRAPGHTARIREDLRLFERYRDGEPAVRDQLVERFLPLARQYRRDGEPLDDLVQVASLGPLKAIERFDPGRGAAFSRYAVPTILGELKRHFRDHGWCVRVPRDVQELAMRVEKVSEMLLAELRRAPTPSEIAEHAGVTTERVLEALEAAGAHWALSFEGPAHDDDDGGGARETFGTEEPGYRVAEAAATVERLMCVLSKREREILRMRFSEDLTQSEIAARIDVSQMHVSRLLRDAITRLIVAAGPALAG